MQLLASSKGGSEEPLGETELCHCHLSPRKYEMLQGCDVARHSSALPGGRHFPAAQVPAGISHSSPPLPFGYSEARSCTKRLANVLGFSPSSGLISSVSPHLPPTTLYPPL